MVASGAAAVLLAPWLIWNLAALHTVFQVSGVAGGYLERRGYSDLHGHGLVDRISHGFSRAAAGDRG